MAKFELLVLVSVAVSGWSSIALAQQILDVRCNVVVSEEQRVAAQEALRLGRYAAAATSFNAAFDACPGRHAILLELSQAYLQLRDFQAAIQAARRFVELEPAALEGRLALADAYFMAQKLQDALRETETVLKTDPAQAGALKLKGNIEYILGHLDRALSAFVSLLDRHPDDEDGAYMLGRIYYQEKLLDHAMGQFKRVLRINPKSYKAMDNLGLCYQAAGNAELAKRYFLSAIKLVEQDHPEYDWPFANLASLLLDEGEDEKAFAFASQAVHRNPNSARNFFLGGKALNKLGKRELSVNWLERSAALDPKYPEPLYLLARLYSQVGEEAKAKAALENFQVLKKNAPRERR